jgi:predicted transcriptional regulator
MGTTTVRVSEKAHRKLRELAAAEGVPMQAALENALDEYERQRFFDAADAAWAALRNDPVAWAEELEERRLWDVTLADGLDVNEVWREDRTVEFVEPSKDAKDTSAR